MIKALFFILILTLFTACKDEIINATDDQFVSGAPELNACHSNHLFSGANNISVITDISATIHWTQKNESLGYSIFKLSNGTFELVETTSPSKSSYKILNLQELIDYSYIVKSIAPDGQHDCNQSVLKFKTLARQTFSSCHDIYNYYGAGIISGEYEIDMDLGGPNPPIDVYCEMSLAGGGWTKILTHRTASGLFTSRNQALLHNENSINEDLYSIISYLEKFKRNGKYEFWIHYPEIDMADEGNKWSQTSNPIDESISVDDDSLKYPSATVIITH